MYVILFSCLVLFSSVISFKCFLKGKQAGKEFEGGVAAYSNPMNLYTVMKLTVLPLKLLR